MTAATIDTHEGKKPGQKQPWFEPMAVVLLSLATVGTAWCSFQAAAWGGVSQRFSNQSAAESRVAAADRLHSQQYAIVDVLLFSQYMNAKAVSNETLARFYSERFRDEAKIAFEAWLAAEPFKNSNAPAHPFVQELYRPRLLTKAAAAEGESQRFWSEAGEAGRTSRSYVLLTVMLASALFCGGTASKFEGLWVRRAVLALGLAAFLFAAGRMLLLPVQL